MRFFVLSLGLALGLNAAASTDRVLGSESVELVNALSHCLPQYTEALKDADRVAKIEFLSPRPRTDAPPVQLEIWRLSLVNFGYPPGPPTTLVSTFEVTKTTHPRGSHGPTDVPPQVSYHCENTRAN